MADNAEKPTVKTSKDVPCCKSLESLPVFTKKETDDTGAKVVNERSMTLLSLLKKTLKRGLKFQEERYLSSDTVYTQR